MIMINYSEKKAVTLLFFFRLAKRLHFYLISAFLDLPKESTCEDIFSRGIFSSILGHYSIMWYSVAESKKHI